MDKAQESKTCNGVKRVSPRVRGWRPVWLMAPANLPPAAAPTPAGGDGGGGCGANGPAGGTIEGPHVPPTLSDLPAERDAAAADAELARVLAVLEGAEVQLAALSPARGRSLRHYRALAVEYHARRDRLLWDVGEAVANVVARWGPG